MILLVDDDDDARLVLAGALTRRGLKVLEARSAAIALDVMAANAIDGRRDRRQPRRD